MGETLAEMLRINKRSGGGVCAKGSGRRDMTLRPVPCGHHPVLSIAYYELQR